MVGLALILVILVMFLLTVAFMALVTAWLLRNRFLKSPVKLAVTTTICVVIEFFLAYSCSELLYHFFGETRGVVVFFVLWAFIFPWVLEKIIFLFERDA